MADIAASRGACEFHCLYYRDVASVMAMNAAGLLALTASVSSPHWDGLGELRGDVSRPPPRALFDLITQR